MEEGPKGGVHIQAGRNVAYAAGEKSIAAGENIYDGVNQQEIKYGNITLNQNYLDKINKEYENSLKQFVEQINKQLQAERIPSKTVAPIQENLNAVAKELEDVKLDEELPTSKEYSIGGKFSAAVEELIYISPQIAETVAACIPILSPFSKLVGKGAEKAIERYRNSKKLQ